MLAVILIGQMSKSEKTILLILAGVTTTLVVYLSLRLRISDGVISLIPGWHTAMYSPDITWTLLTVIVLVTSVTVYMVFCGTIKLLTTLWTRLKS